MVPGQFSRRKFIKAATVSFAITALDAGGLAAIVTPGPLKVALIGTGWYGKSDLFKLIQVEPVEVVALCDVDRNLLEDAAKMVSSRQVSHKTPQLYSDYRKMLAAHKLDIVLIGTPDHWHALTAIAAMQAGAHVYVQKPISVDLLEGEAMLAAARRYKRVVQVGTQRRSTPHLIDAKTNIVEKGLLGKIAHVEMCCYYHMRNTQGLTPQSIPTFLDYEMWTGPAPVRSYDGLPHRGWWRSFMEYSNGIMGDMCIHMFDAVRWMLQLGWPLSISSTGGIYVDKQSKANISDTQSAIFEYKDLNCVWQHRTWGKAADPEYPWSFIIYGDKGTLKASVMKYEFNPVDGEGKTIHGEAVYEKEKYPEDLTEPDIELHTAAATRGHMIDFLKAIRQGGLPVADIEQGHISTASCILANMSMKLGRPLVYDPVNKIVTGDTEATRLLQRPYRQGWKHPYGKQ